MNGGAWKLPDLWTHQNASTNALENAQSAFPTAPTRVIVIRLIIKTVTYVPGQECYLGRRPLNP